MTNPKWEIGPVKLANGVEAFIDAINLAQEDFRYVGRYVIGLTWHPAGWHANGRMMYATRNNGCNLAPPPKKTVRVQRWTVVYFDGSTAVFFEKEKAVDEAEKNGFALLEVDREVTEGEGL